MAPELRPLAMKLRLVVPLRRFRFTPIRKQGQSIDCSVDHAPCFTLPPELWLEIISILPEASMLALTLTCQSLKDLSQPFIFQRISFHLSLGKLNMERLSRRLLFMASVTIAHHVEECSILVEKRTSDSNALERATDAIFDVMGGFPNLIKLVFTGVDLTRKRLQDLTMLSMSIVELKSCMIHHTDEISIPVKTFICNYAHPSNIKLAPIAQNYSSFLDPLNIQSIIAGPASAECIITSISDSLSSYTRLTRLTIPVDTMTSAPTLRAISSCSQIRHLNLSFTNKPPVQILTSFPAALLPNLESFDGPHQYAALLSSGRASSSTPFPTRPRPIHKMTLRPFSNTTFSATLAPLLHSLTAISNLSAHLTTLDILAITALSPILPLLRSAAPSLKHLAMNAHPEFYARCVTPGDAARDINTYGLPAGLMHLRLGVQMRAVDSGTRRWGEDGRFVWDAARRWCVDLEEVRMWFWTQPKPAWVVCSETFEKGTVELKVRMEY